jgi:DsbC/DsbD-like thiol-disulfide interchange protein
VGSRLIALSLRRVGVIAVAAGLVHAPAVRAQNPVSWTAHTVASGVSTGGASVIITLTATIDNGWHVYSLTQAAGGPTPLRITLPPDSMFVLAGAVKGPTPVTSVDSNFKMTVETYQGQAAFIVPVQPAAGAPGGSHTLTIKARYQACTVTICLPPKTVTVALPLAVTVPKKT